MQLIICIIFSMNLIFLGFLNESSKNEYEITKQWLFITFQLLATLFQIHVLSYVCNDSPIYVKLEINECSSMWNVDCLVFETASRGFLEGDREPEEHQI